MVTAAEAERTRSIKPESETPVLESRRQTLKPSLIKIMQPNTFYLLPSFCHSRLRACLGVVWGLLDISSHGSEHEQSSGFVFFVKAARLFLSVALLMSISNIFVLMSNLSLFITVIFAGANVAPNSRHSDIKYMYFHGLECWKFILASPPTVRPLFICHMYHNNCLNTSWGLRKSVFRAVPWAVTGPLFRHNECVRDQTSCKVNVGEKNEVHLTSIYSPQLRKITCALVLPHDIFLPITKSHKDPQSVLRVCAPSALLSWLRLCLRAWCTCANSAAVT